MKTWFRYNWTAIDFESYARRLQRFLRILFRQNIFTYLFGSEPENMIKPDEEQLMNNALGIILLRHIFTLNLTNIPWKYPGNLKMNDFVE